MKRKKALYQIIVDDIVQQIVAGNLKKGDRLPTEQNLIEKYEVSRITARRAFQDLEDNDIIIRRKGSGSYVTGVFPRGEISSTVNNRIISLAIPFHSNLGGCFELIHGIGDYLNAEGYVLTVEHMSSILKERQFLLSLKSSPLTGFLFYPSTGHENLDVILSLDASTVPIVFLDKYFEGTSLVSVVSDNYGGTRSSVEHLVALGHTEIAFVSNMDLNVASSVRDRYQGYCAGLRDAGIQVDLSNVVAVGKGATGDLYSSYYEAMTAGGISTTVEESLMVQLLAPLFNHSNSVTAILAINDYMAIDIARTLTRMGIRVPLDVSVVGFDNIELSSQIEIPITTVAQDFYEIGVTAARVLLSKLLGENNHVRSPIVIPTKSVIRNSTAEIGSGLISNN